MKPHERIKWVATLRVRSTFKAVLYSLIRWTNDEGVCWPSVASIAHASGLGVRQVKRVLRVLEKAKVVHRIIPSEHKSSTYRVTMTGDSMSSLMCLPVTQTVHRTLRKKPTKKKQPSKPRRKQMTSSEAYLTALQGLRADCSFCGVRKAVAEGLCGPCIQNPHRKAIG